MRLKPALSMLSLLLVTTTQASCGAKTTAPAIGLGNTSCMSWQSMTNEERNVMKQWVMGYLSGYNAFYRGNRTRTFFSYDADSAADAILYYCWTRKGESLSQATGEWLISQNVLTAGDLKTRSAPPKLN